MVEIKDAALDYQSKNFSIIPVQKNKKPYIKWEEYQNRKSTKDEVNEWWTKWPDAMIGIITGNLNNIFVIDVDSKQGAENLSNYIPESLVTPTSKTPRGGQHLYFLYPEEKITIGAGVIPGTDFRGDGGFIIAPPSQNSLNKKYEWKEGLSIVDVPLSPLPKEYLLFILKSSQSGYVQSENEEVMFVKGRRDNDLFHIANILSKAKEPDWAIRQTLERLALSCNPPFPLSQIQEKIESALKRSEKRDYNLTQEIRNWISISNGNFSSTECIRQISEELGLSKKAIGHYRSVFQRLCKEEIIEKDSKRDGWFRRIETDYTEIDLEGEEEKPLDIVWPFGLERFYNCLPKNICVIAGAADSGKTAFCLNFALNNLTKYKINYFTSEMGETEIKSRLKYFEVPISKWKVIRWVQLSTNFSDAVRPDEINIIDFLEIHDEFWKVSAWLNDIYRKLQKGMALIALQRPRGRDIAKGGEATLEKPRLYLSMGNNVIKIIKCKNWVDPEKNPNGLSLEYKILRGAKFIQISEWGIPLLDYGK